MGGRRSKQLTLTSLDQTALIALLSAAPVPGSPLPTRDVLTRLVRLVPCQGVSVLLRDPGGQVLDHVELGVPSHDVELTVRFGDKSEGFLELRLGRDRFGFSQRDLAMMEFLRPVLARLFAERLTPGLEMLTSTERRVLNLVVAGFSNADIADTLSVSPNTVRKHVEHIYRKLSVDSRLAAVAKLRGAVERSGPTTSAEDTLERE